MELTPWATAVLQYAPGVTVGSAGAGAGGGRRGRVGLVRRGQLARALGEDAGDGIVLGLRDPEAVGGLHRDPAGDVRAAEGGVRRQPGGGVAVALLLIGGPVGGLEVERVVGAGHALGVGELLGALLPGVGEGDDVVDLHRVARTHPAQERDGRGGVGVGEGAGGDGAGDGRDVGDVRQVAVEHVVAVSQPFSSASSQAGPNWERS
ncbi:hypothetical protein GCM10027449_11380 [Sinomonas notoginsengisoli]